VLKLLGIFDPNYPLSPRPVASSPWTKKQILDLIIQSDIEVRTWIADTLNHPLRNAETFVTSDTLNDGALVPFSQSEHRYVTVSFSDDTLPGSLAPSFEDLQLWKYNAEIFGSHPHLYFIINGRVYLGDENATCVIEIADIKPNRTANAGEGSIKTPLRYEWAVTANTLKMTAMHLQNSANKEQYARLGVYYETQIKQGNLSIPTPELFQRLAT
jgi:hypothetical protein